MLVTLKLLSVIISYQCHGATVPGCFQVPSLSPGAGDKHVIKGTGVTGDRYVRKFTKKKGILACAVQIPGQKQAVQSGDTIYYEAFVAIE